MGIDLPVIWAIIIFFGVFMYVVMDGFDLGIGMLFPFVPDRHDRDVMMNTVAPVWDGNETWLVLGGAGLLAAFPLAYSVILSGLYLPLIFMLLGLIFRGVAFEFRFKARENERHIWDKAFIGGSVTAAYFQGVALGAFLQGIPVTGRAYAGGPLDWVAPFPLLSGVGTMIAYTLLGSTWLIMKTEGELQQRMIQVARPFSLMLLGAIGVVSVWTPLSDPQVAARWFSFPNLFYFAPVPLLVAVGFFWLLRSLKGAPHRSPFVAALGLIFLGYSGMAISIWPHIVPPHITIWTASSPPQSQGFALVGTLFILPFILGYTVWSYYVFRGKVRVGEGYH
ncbi:MAG: putative Cytochrome bd2, subunit [Massilia sp.]|jgi:cytochrome d ubiquinol oxidase subunit II|nr:putative Cytochrome bd2, subunit [Massilia sp.]